jgi:hypothetical protein
LLTVKWYHHVVGVSELLYCASLLELDTTMAVFDSSSLASEAYALATSSEPIAGLVKEALEGIDGALDEYGCAAHFSDDPFMGALPMRPLTTSLLDLKMYP